MVEGVMSLEEATGLANSKYSTLYGQQGCKGIQTERIHNQEAVSWDRKIKRKRSMGTVFARSIDGERELERDMYLKPPNESGQQSSDAQGLRVCLISYNTVGCCSRLLRSFMGNFLQILLRNFLQILLGILLRKFLADFLAEISCGFTCKNITHEGITWGRKSAGKSAENAGISSSVICDDALGKAILFFEGQRSGKLPTNQRAKWRGDSALSDGKPQNVDLVGGYYDAGDNVKFGWPMSFTVTLLSWAGVEYESEISSVNQLGYLHSAIRWGADFILQAHTSPTTLITQVGDGNADHQCWERPEDMDTPRTVYKIDANSPGTEAAAEAAAALSAASIVFKKTDASYSSMLLSKSKSLFDFADKYKGSYSGSCPFYCSYSGYQDELLWAASWLYKASGESKYLSYTIDNQGWSQAVSEFSWDNKFVGAQTLLTEVFYSGKKDLAKIKSDAESFICAVMPGSSSLQIQTTPGGLLYTRDSSNLQYATSSTMVLFIFSKILKRNHIDGIQCGSVHFSHSEIRAFAKTQVDYILGNNPKKMSYMVGFGSKYPKQLHHRGSSIPSIKAHPAKVGCNDGQSNYFASSNPNPNTHVGAIVGGPDSNDQFNDVRSDYSHAEPTTYMNAAFVGSVVALLAKTEPGTLQFPHTGGWED